MMRTDRRVVICAVLLAFPLLSWAQPPGRPMPGPGGVAPAPPTPPRGNAPNETQPRGTAVVRGAVVAADSGAPLRHAQVRATGSGTGTRVVTTDAQGVFEIRDLSAGRYAITAAKAGFVTMQYGQKRAGEGGTPLEIADGQRVDKVLIALPRGSVISGRVSDEFGEPVANAVVSAMRYGYVAGVKRLVAPGVQNARDTTDDQGSFRLFGLPPGEYVVSAVLRTGGDGAAADREQVGYAPTYFPGTPSITDAARVNVGLGQEQSGIAFSLIATRLARVGGAVLSAQGTPASAGAVTLVPVAARLGAGAAVQSFTGRIEAGGQFRITSVPPGRYVATARVTTPRGAAAGRGPDAAAEFARQEIAVTGEDLNGLVLVTAPGGRLTGQIVSVPGATGTLQPQQITVVARALEPDVPAGPAANARVHQDWTFELAGVFEPRLLRVNLPRGWYLKSVLRGGEDITDTAIDVSPGQTLTGIQIVLTDRPTELNGRVVDDRGRPVIDATVVVFPADPDRWTYQSRFVQTARPDQDGQFHMRGLPPFEEYLAIAVEGLEEGQAGDPEFLASVRAGATALSLGENETRALDLRWSARR
jgi:protocatechuate 3,4-dioxygenase beta subunit